MSVASKSWAGKTVVIIASGPSLTQSDCDLVEASGLTTIAVNTSWKRARFAHVLYAGDLAWWDAYANEIDIDAERWTCTRQAAKKYGINLHTAYGEYNSGMRAIQLAIDKGASRVLLVGYDCSLKEGVHWHGEHDKTKNPNDFRVRKWHRHFATVAVAARRKGVRVVNCSRRTDLRAFERGDLERELSTDGGAVPVLIRGMHGLGDSIYQRAFLKNLPGAYLETSWPELYADLDVKPVRPTTRLRTQRKNVANTSAVWHQPQGVTRRMAIGYGGRELAAGSILTAMRRQFGVEPGELDLPAFASPINTDRPFAIVRPVTERREWHNPARNPRPEYVARAAEELRRRGYFVVSVADLADGQEWLVGEPPEADLVLHAGEWPVSDLLGAVQAASVVVGGVGWIVPACIAAKTPLYVIHGGHGGHNHRSKITAPWMDVSRVGWAEPRGMCMCTNMRHRCAKEIDGFDASFSAWLDGQSLFGASVPRARLVA